MYKGTTPKVVFSIPDKVDLASMKEVWVTFSVKDTKLTLKRTENEVALDNAKKTITVHLSQEQTLAFAVGTCAVQIRFLANNDEAFSTNILNIKIKDVLEGGVIK